MASVDCSKAWDMEAHRQQETKSETLSLEGPESFLGQGVSVKLSMSSVEESALLCHTQRLQSQAHLGPPSSRAWSPGLGPSEGPSTRATWGPQAPLTPLAPVSLCPVSEACKA